MNSNELINYRIAKAKETIIEAENTAKISHWNTCVNRLYYIVFML